MYSYVCMQLKFGERVKSAITALFNIFHLAYPLFPWLSSELLMKQDFQIFSVWDAYCFLCMSSSLFLAINKRG